MVTAPELEPVRAVRRRSERIPAWATSLTTVLVAGALVRLALMPLWHGQDFVVWRIVARELLRGSNFYAHKPADLPGGPYAYPPLFAYLEVPFKLLANVTGIPFRILGKIPIVAGDALVAWALVRWGRRADLAAGALTALVACWWLNPLVLYNGAFYGRFDSLVLGLLLVALLTGPPRDSDSRWWSPSAAWFGAAIAAKTFPAFILPWFWRNGRNRAKLLTGIVTFVGVVSLPFVAAPLAFIDSTVLYDTGKTPTNLSWQVALKHLFDSDTTRAIGTFVLLGFIATLFLLTRLDLTEYCAAAFCAFVVFSKIVNEQYLVWAIPFLAMLAVAHRARPHAWLLGLYTLIGTILNPSVHVLGHQGSIHTLWVNVVLAGATVAYLVWQMRRHPRPDWVIDHGPVGDEVVHLTPEEYHASQR